MIPDNRQSIRDTLRNGPLWPYQVYSACKAPLSRGTIAAYLRHMVKDGEVTTTTNGKYALPSPKETPSMPNPQFFVSLLAARGALSFRSLRWNLPSPLPTEEAVWQVLEQLVKEGKIVKRPAAEGEDYRDHTYYELPVKEQDYTSKHGALDVAAELFGSVSPMLNTAYTEGVQDGYDRAIQAINDLIAQNSQDFLVKPVAEAFKTHLLNKQASYMPAERKAA